MKTPWRVAVIGASALALVAGVEAWARLRGLDLLQGQAISVREWADLGQRTWPSGEALGVDYLPRELHLDDGGLTTRWGRCDADWPGRQLLVLGDSTTRQLGLPQGWEGPPDPPAWSWPARLDALLPEDVQVCVVAEDGYHPADHLALARGLLARLDPDLLLVLLCVNDLEDEPERLLRRQGQDVVFTYPPTTLLAWPPMHGEALHRRSAAWRFVSWRLARATGRTMHVPSGVPTPRRAAEALAGLSRLGPPLMARYLPPLVDGDDPSVERARAVFREAGVDGAALSLPPPRAALRVHPPDAVHMNERGHALVADQIAREVQARL